MKIEVKEKDEFNEKLASDSKTKIKEDNSTNTEIIDLL
jgi:hypothetical protein